MAKVNWLNAWDELYRRVLTDKTSWGRLELKNLMEEIERKVVREAEKGDS